MNLGMFLIILTLVGVFAITSNAIALQAFNDNPTYKKDNQSKAGYIMFSLVASVLLLVGGYGYAVLRHSNVPGAALLKSAMDKQLYY